ncbi:MAG: phenylalanine--tRNA ligase subunit beta [Thermoplasmatota archaeon]
MPVINMSIPDLSRLVGEDFSLQEFMERIPMIGASVEKVEDDEIAVEFFPDRPDLFCVEGVARAYRAFTGKEPERDLSRSMKVEGDSAMELEVDPGMLEVRPVIGAAYITGVQIDDDALVSIMNLQEKLHITVGRKRKKVAIGIHDADPITGPFRFWPALPEEVEFVPLQKDGNWNLRRILEEHEKGVDYAWTLQGLDRYPLITDSKDEVLSFPPIINGELTRVTGRTRNIFVDCTGWDLNAVSLSVNIVCSQLLSRGGKLHSVKVRYPEGKGFEEMGLKTRTWPFFEWKEVRIDRDWAANWLGKDLEPAEISDSLHRMGYENTRVEGGKIICLAPPWRGDLLHQADIAEDLAIGYGFDRFQGTDPRIPMVGSERKLTTISRSLRSTLVGMGFLEVRTISLSNEAVQFELMGRDEVEHLRITNPITTEHTTMRMSAIPSLLSLLRSNKHRDLPQKIFEVADVMVGNRNRVLLGGLSEDNKASFTEIKGIVQRLLSDLGIKFELVPASLGCYIRGRGAAIHIKGKEGDLKPFPELSKKGMVTLGHFGEIHPRMIAGMELSAPVSGFEMDLDAMISTIN